MGVARRRRTPDRRLDWDALPARGRSRVRGRSRRRTSGANRRVLLQRAAIVAVLAALAVMVLGLAFAGSSSRLADGVQIAGVDVGGMTPGHARAVLDGPFEGPRGRSGHLPRRLPHVEPRAAPSGRARRLARRCRRRAAAGQRLWPLARFPPSGHALLRRRRGAADAGLRRSAAREARRDRGRRQRRAPRRLDHAARAGAPDRGKPDRACSRQACGGRDDRPGTRKSSARARRSARSRRPAESDSRRAQGRPGAGSNCPVLIRPSDARRDALEPAAAADRQGPAAAGRRTS